MPAPHAYSLPGKNHQAYKKWRKLDISLNSIDISAEKAFILDILEEGELPEESMDITVPPNQLVGGVMPGDMRIKKIVQ